MVVTIAGTVMPSHEWIARLSWPELLVKYQDSVPTGGHPSM